MISNPGKIVHEFSIGDEKEHLEQRKWLQEGHHMMHQAGNRVIIKPGETRVIIWKFSGKQEVIFSCNLPGHFEAGMFHRVTLK